MFKLNKKKLIYFSAAGIFIFFLASFIPAARPPALNALKYPLKIFTLFGREIKGIIFYHRNLIRNERLEKETGFLKSKLNAQSEIFLENQQLKSLLSLKQKSPFKVIAVSVIGRSPDNWSSTLIIDKGSSAGIKRGNAAISYLGLVGRVCETSAYVSKIVLINDPSLAVSAIVQRSRQEGLVSGTLGSTLVMRYLPKDADIQSSDVISTSGLTSVYPKGLLIGAVVEVGEEFSGLGRYAIIKPAVNLSSIEEVLIIIP